MTPPLRKKPAKKDILEEVVKRSGLTRNTVRELLKAGWRYAESTNESYFAGPKKSSHG